MEDKEFLMWLHERLVSVHKEKPTYDYMHKLRAIIKETPEDKRTIDYGSGNDLGELRKMMANA